MNHISLSSLGHFDLEISSAQAQGLDYYATAVIKEETESDL